MALRNMFSAEDSGLVDPSFEDVNMYTPTTSTLSSRKRKFAKMSNYKQTPCSSETSPSFDANVFSSTMNESITTGLEKCNLDSFATNFYVERTELFDTDTPSTQGTRADSKVIEPVTPTKSKSYFSCYKPMSPLQKLGSPERNEILYPNLYQTSLIKFNEGKTSSPAKKRLFSSFDPVHYIWNKKYKYPDVVSKIFHYLSDEDLYSCYKVCKNWRSAVTFDASIKRRLETYIKFKVMDKENFGARSYESMVCYNACQATFKDVSFPNSFEAENMTEITNILSDGQHFEKCIHCNARAIVDRNISQCTRELCGYIRCVDCNSFSATGPENFFDKCQKATLVFDKPNCRHASLESLERPNESGIPSFLLNNSYIYSQTMNSSGYATDADSSMSSRRSSFPFKRVNLRILQTNNTDFTTAKVNNERRYTIASVVPLNLKKLEDPVDPPSPPKYAPCSKKSKKFLKRLRY